MRERESSAEIDAAAAEWAVRVDHAPLADAERAELEAWLAGDIRRRGAFVRAKAVLLQARRTRALGTDFDPAASVAGTLDGDAEAVPSDDIAEIDEAPTRRRFLVWGGSAAVAASVLLAVGLGLRGGVEAYETELGEVRLVPLSDGSRMTLNTGSKARVRFSEKERRVELIDGEILFDVAKDAKRPFYVFAGETQVRAVGTSFTVRRLPGKPVQVLVREGVVEVRGNSSPASKPQRVAANMRAVAPPGAAMETVALAPAEVGRELAWREGMLSFEDQSLSQAAQEFARYSDQHIHIADPTLGAETITGLYAANDPQGFARAAALSLGIKAETTSDGILLRR